MRVGGRKAIDEGPPPPWSLVKGLGSPPHIPEHQIANLLGRFLGASQPAYYRGSGLFGLALFQMVDEGDEVLDGLGVAALDPADVRIGSSAAGNEVDDQLAGLIG